MNKIQISRALAYYNLKTGKTIRQNELAEMLEIGEAMVSQWANGMRKFIEIKRIHELCTLLLVDANFLFDIKPKPKKKITGVVGERIEIAKVKILCDNFNVDANSLFGIKPMK